MRRISSLLFCSVLVVSIGLTPQKIEAQWQPVAPTDLALKDNPAQPGAKAMILYRSVEEDDTLGTQTEYVRLKIFTQAGAEEYGDVELPIFDRYNFNVESVKARTIHPDG